MTIDICVEKLYNALFDYMPMVGVGSTNITIDGGSVMMIRRVNGVFKGEVHSDAMLLELAVPHSADETTRLRFLKEVDELRFMSCPENAEASKSPLWDKPRWTYVFVRWTDDEGCVSAEWALSMVVSRMASFDRTVISVCGKDDAFFVVVHRQSLDCPRYRHVPLVNDRLYGFEVVLGNGMTISRMVEESRTLARQRLATKDDTPPKTVPQPRQKLISRILAILPKYAAIFLLGLVLGVFMGEAGGWNTTGGEVLVPAVAGILTGVFLLIDVVFWLYRRHLRMSR